MIIFPNTSAKFFFWAYAILMVFGLTVFIKNIARKDWQFEMAYPWSLRGLIYVFSAPLWFVAVPIGIWLRTGDRNRKKLASGLLWTCAMGICFTLAGYFGWAIS